MKKNIIIGLSAALLLSACGGGGSNPDKTNTSSSSSDASSSVASFECPESHLGQPLNSIGYFGDDVCFAGMKIVGTWQDDDGFSFILNDDGSMEEFKGKSSPDLYYGVVEDGQRFIISILGSKYDYRYLSDHENENCINGIRTKYNQVGGFTKEVLLCRID